MIARRGSNAEFLKKTSSKIKIEFLFNESTAETFEGGAFGIEDAFCPNTPHLFFTAT